MKFIKALVILSIIINVISTESERSKNKQTPSGLPENILAEAKREAGSFYEGFVKGYQKALELPHGQPSGQAGVPNGGGSGFIPQGGAGVPGMGGRTGGGYPPQIPGSTPGSYPPQVPGVTPPPAKPGIAGRIGNFVDKKVGQVADVGKAAYNGVKNTVGAIGSGIANTAKAVGKVLWKKREAERRRRLKLMKKMRKMRKLRRLRRH